MNTVRRLVSSFSVVIALLLSVPSLAAGMSDQELAQKAASAVRKYPFYSIFEYITLSVEEGHVTLEGQVYQPSHRTDLERLVSCIEGVSGVENRLEVLPNSFYDDELRRRIARAIYRDPVLSGYSLRADPPIHIIVKNGHVTLKGVVLTEVQRAVAERNARHAATFFSLDNQLKVERSSRATTS